MILSQAENYPIFMMYLLPAIVLLAFKIVVLSILFAKYIYVVLCHTFYGFLTHFSSSQELRCLKNIPPVSNTTGKIFPKLLVEAFQIGASLLINLANQICTTNLLFSLAQAPKWIMVSDKPSITLVLFQ